MFQVLSVPVPSLFFLASRMLNSDRWALLDVEEVLIPDCRSWLQSAKKMLPNVRFMRFYRLELEEKAGKRAFGKHYLFHFGNYNTHMHFSTQWHFFLNEFYVIHFNIPRDVPSQWMKVWEFCPFARSSKYVNKYVLVTSPPAHLSLYWKRVCRSICLKAERIVMLSCFITLSISKCFPRQVAQWRINNQRTGISAQQWCKWFLANRFISFEKNF